MDQNQNRNQDPNNNKGPKNKQSLLVLLICIMVSLFGMNMLSRMTSNVSGEISNVKNQTWQGNSYMQF